MSLNIKNKRSAVRDSAPTAEQLQDGEIGINYNAQSPALYIKDSAGAIVKLAGDSSVGNYWELDGSNLKPDSEAYNVVIGDGDITLSADGNVALTGKGTSDSTVAGDDDATLTTKDYVDAAVAGAAGATDLGLDNRNADTLDVTSSTGTDVTIPAATDSLSGLMTAGDKSLLDSLPRDVGVTSIVAGTNITIDPGTGVGDVTINATGGGGGGASIEVSDDPPGSPSTGDLWWDSSETADSNGGRLYMYYTDQWVQTSNIGGGSGGGGTSLWTRDGTTLSPANSGDDLDDIGSITAAGNVNINNGTQVHLSRPDGTQTQFVDVADIALDIRSGTNDISGRKITINGGGSITAAGDVEIGNGNVTLGADGTCNFNPGGNSQTDAGITFSNDGLTTIYRPTGSNVSLLDLCAGPSTKIIVASVMADGTLKIGGTLSGPNQSPNIALNANGTSTFRNDVRASSAAGEYAGLSPSGTLEARGNGNLLQCKKGTTGANMVVVDEDGRINSVAETGGYKDIQMQYDQGNGVIQDRIFIRAQSNSGYINVCNGNGGSTITLSGQNGDITVKDTGLTTNFSVAGQTGTISAKNPTVQPISSERRLKENIIAIDADTAWETIKSTPYYTYNFIGNESTSYGPMVDEVPADMVVQPMIEDEDGNQVANADAEGPIRTYDNGMLQARLYTALQTALTRIEALEAQLAALSGSTTTDIQEAN